MDFKISEEELNVYSFFTDLKTKFLGSDPKLLSSFKINLTAEESNDYLGTFSFKYLNPSSEVNHSPVFPLKQFSFKSGDVYEELLHSPKKDIFLRGNYSSNENILYNLEVSSKYNLSKLKTLEIILNPLVEEMIDRTKNFIYRSNVEGMLFFKKIDRVYSLSDNAKLVDLVYKR